MDAGRARRAALALGLGLGSACTASSAATGAANGTAVAGPRATSTSLAGHDRALEAAVQATFARDPRLIGEKLDVAAVRGVVSIDGSVGTLLAEQRVTADAKTVSGVSALIARVALVRPFVGDIQLAGRLQRALATEPVTAPYAIGVEVRDGVAQLQGQVGSWQALRVARDLAAATAGVVRVRAGLTVDPELGRTDANVRAEVESRLRDDIEVDPRLVRVAVQDGTVDLSGEVSDSHARALVTEDAWGTGVRGVHARLRLTLEPSPVPTSGPWPLDDATIRAAVLDVLEQDLRLTGARPAVAVHEGVVNLEGAAPDGFARAAADADAENVVGVVDVHDDLRIDGGGELPDRVSEAVAASLRLQVDTRRLRVTARDGVVILHGQVPSDRARNEADRIARHVPGVQEVRDALQVVHSPPADRDDELRADARAALGRASGVPVTRIDVAASEGIVTLEGTVASASKGYTAIAAAYQAGAIAVRNRLTLEP